MISSASSLLSILLRSNETGLFNSKFFKVTSLFCSNSFSSPSKLYLFNTGILNLLFFWSKLKATLVSNLFPFLHIIIFTFSFLRILLVMNTTHLSTCSRPFYVSLFAFEDLLSTSPCLFLFFNVS